MKRFKYVAATALILTMSAFMTIATQDWQIGSNYSIQFSSSDAGGIFKTFKGTVVFDEANLNTSKFDVAIDVASINTGNGLQNKHAKSDEWLDATKYPVIKFTSKKIAKAGAGYQVIGDLDMHGVKKELTFPFTFKKAGTGGIFSGSFTVNRSDYKIGKPGGEVGEAIKVDVSVPVTKK